jgi:hypothetical protein
VRVACRGRGSVVAVLAGRGGVEMFLIWLLTCTVTRGSPARTAEVSGETAGGRGGCHIGWNC